MWEIQEDEMGFFISSTNWFLRHHTGISKDEIETMIYRNRGEVISAVAQWDRHRFPSRENCQKFVDEIEALIIMNEIVGKNEEWWI